MYRIRNMLSNIIWDMSVILLLMLMIRNYAYFMAAITKETIIVRNECNVFAVFIGITKNVCQVRYSRVQHAKNRNLT